MRRFTSGLVLLFCLSSAKLANATAIYDFNLPANGAVSSFDIELTFPDLLPAGGLLVIFVTSPEVTSLSFKTPGLSPFLSNRSADHAHGYLVRSFIAKCGGCSASVYGRFPGRLLCIRPYAVDYRDLLVRFRQRCEHTASSDGSSPVGTLTVTSVPEPPSLLLLASGLLCLAWRRLGKKRSES